MSDFDPEKVERLQVADEYNMCPATDPAFPVFVSESDYDKLLELYREAVMVADRALFQASGEPFVIKWPSLPDFSSATPRAASAPSPVLPPTAAQS